MKKINLPNVKKPCKDCPFRKDSMKGWLGTDRMTEILDSDTFVCHKKMDLQCAGHMLLLKKENIFYRMAQAMKIDLGLSGEELVFDNKKDCINHHSN